MDKRFFFNQFSEAASNAKYTVEIYDGEYTGSAIQIEGSFKLRYDQGKIGDFLLPLLPSYAEININVNAEDTEFENFLQQIVGSPEDRFVVVILRNDVKIWKGQMPTDLIEYPDDFYTYTVTLSAVCGLSRLKDIKYDNNGEPYTGRNTILGHMLRALSKLNYPETLGYSPLLKISDFAWKEQNLLSTDSGLQNIDLAYDDFQEYDDFGVIESMNCFDVLENICRQFHYRLFMSGDCFFAQQINDMNASNTYTYSQNGTLLLVDNMDYRLYFTTERTDGYYTKYRAVDEMSLIYHYKQGINGGNLLPPKYNLGSTFDLGEIIGSNGEALIIKLSGLIKVLEEYIGDRYYLSYRLLLKIGSKYLGGSQGPFSGDITPFWSLTPVYYNFNIYSEALAVNVPFDILIQTPNIDPGGLGTFSLEFIDTYTLPGTPIILPPNTFQVIFNFISCNYQFDVDNATNGKIKYTASIDNT